MEDGGKLAEWDREETQDIAVLLSSSQARGSVFYKHENLSQELFSLSNLGSYNSENVHVIATFQFKAFCVPYVMLFSLRGANIMKICENWESAASHRIFSCCFLLSSPSSSCENLKRMETKTHCLEDTYNNGITQDQIYYIIMPSSILYFYLTFLLCVTVAAWR